MGDNEKTPGLLVQAGSFENADEGGILSTSLKPASVKTFDEVKSSNEFKAFWALYPRRVAKAKAVMAYRKALGKVSPAVIYEGLERFAASVHSLDSLYIKHASTWLDRECWEDEISMPRVTLPVDTSEQNLAKWEAFEAERAKIPRVAL